MSAARKHVGMRGLARTRAHAHMYLGAVRRRVAAADQPPCPRSRAQTSQAHSCVRNVRAAAGLATCTRQGS